MSHDTTTALTAPTAPTTDERAASGASAVRYERDSDGIVVLTLDDPGANANTMNAAYREAMGVAMDRLEAERDDIAGVVVTSAKTTFFAGANLDDMMKAGPDDAPSIFAIAEAVKSQLRRLETCGRPVVAALNGSALGGGLEIALACHRRIVTDDDRIQLGLPEVTLGLMPGGGGVTRTVRMLGLQSALVDVLLQGPRMTPKHARAKGLVDDLAPDAAALMDAAKGWVLEHRDDPDAATQPWDQPGYRMPGGTPSSPRLAATLPAFPAMLRQQTKGADYPAPRAILAAAVEGAQVDIETASRIESRYLTSLVIGQNAKNMMQAFFFDMQAVTSGARQTAEPAATTSTASKLGVLGAGMMGAGIAYVAARAGLDVVLKDVTQANAQRGKEVSIRLLDKAVARGKLTEQDAETVLARITPTGDATDLAGCDVVVEAVFEDPALKAKVLAEVTPIATPDALVCTNTSSLPITELAQGVDRPADFIGMHFFSPVDKMPLVEIIRGAATSEETVARAVDVVRLLGKTPIVVNDSRGFYTSRVYATLLTEAAALLEEGVPPVTVERAATLAGFPAPPLAMLDEVSLTLTRSIRRAAEEAMAPAGKTVAPVPGVSAIDRMIDEFGRSGKAAGAGFYEYPADGSAKFPWPDLREHFGGPDSAAGAGAVDPLGYSGPVSLADIKDRYLFVMALETARCLDEGVLDSAAAANIGSILGIGFPPLTGGTVQFMVGYPGGLPGFVARARELATRYGERFAPPASLVDLAERGGSFPA